MVIQDTATEIPSSGFFYWFFTDEEIEEIDGKKRVRFEVDTVKWVAGSKAEAYRWYRLSPNAAAVKSKAGGTPHMQG